MVKSSSRLVAEKDAKIDKLQKVLDESRAGVLELKGETDKHVLEIKDKGNEISRAASLKDKVEATINQWKPQYDSTLAKIKVIFEYCANHLEACRPFRDVLRTLFVKFEPNTIENFDAETRNMDVELGAGTPLRDIVID